MAGATFAVVAGARARARVPRGAAVAAALGALALLAAGCGSESSGEDGQVKVVATTTQVADFVREVGGEAVEVTQIIQPNSDPHDYEPRPSDVEAVADAELVFVSGRGLDDWAEELVSDSGSDAQIVNLGAMGPIRLAGEGRIGARPALVARPPQRRGRGAGDRERAGGRRPAA